MSRLTPETKLPDRVKGPDYNSAAHNVGIVHIGFGSFHRAHQALYTDDAIASHGGDWRITGVSLRSNTIADNINAQRGLYSVLIRGDNEESLRVIGCVRNVIAINNPATDSLCTAQTDAMFKALTNANTRVVTLTVTEKAYGFDRKNGGVVDTHPAIKRDLDHPHEPAGIIGILVEALSRRRILKLPPFTIVCCDNLPANGRLLKAGVIDFANRLNTDLADYIERQVSFPCTMVDRITPAISDETLLEIASELGSTDLAAVETEAFSQWVIEDDFPTGRPYWEAGGAVFVDDVEPYETMKLRMLNGTHSLIAYSGYLAGFSK